MYKMLLLDLDQTVKKNNTISQKNINAIQKCSQQGIHVILTSERDPAEITPYIQRLSLESELHIAGGGTLIFHGDQQQAPIGKMIQEDYYSLLHALKANKFKFAVHADEKLFLENFQKVKDEIPYFTSKTPYVMGASENAKEPVRVEVFCYSKDQRSYLKSLRRGKLTACKIGENRMEFKNKDSSKLTAAMVIAEKLGIHKKEIISIGGSEADIPAFKNVGLSIALANAMDTAKEFADIILMRSTDEDGVAYAIENFVCC